MGSVVLDMPEYVMMFDHIRGRCLRLLGVAALAALAGSAQADSITFSGSSGGRAASVKFETSGSNLIVTLSNTATGGVPSPAYGLTGVFYTMTPNLTLTPLSAEIGAGGSVANPTKSDNLPIDANGNGLLEVGGEFAYRADTTWASSTQGITSVGLGPQPNDFGSIDWRFPGPGLDNPDSPNGLNYAIATADYVNGKGNGGVKKEPLIRNSVVFTLDGLPAGFSVASNISNVTFLYGTSLGEFEFQPPPPPPPPPGDVPPGVPLPAVGLVGAALFGGLGLKRRRG